MSDVRATPFTLLLAAFVAGCFAPPADSTTESGGSNGGDSAADGVTWYNSIQPIVMENCAGCHYQGSLLSSMPFDTYEASKSLSGLMLAKIVGDENAPYNMPPFPPPDQDPSCELPAGFSNDTRLSAEQVALFQEWIDSGLEEGDPATAAPFTQQPAPELLGDNVVEFPGVDHEVPAASLDESGNLDIDHTKCFSIGMDPDNPVLIDALAVVADPQHPDAIHHVIIGTDPTGASYTGADGGDPNDGRFHWCETDEIPDTLLLYTFTPGGFPLYFPEKSAYELPAGSRLTFTVHYHMADTVVTDNTTLRLRFTDEEPEYLAYMDRFGAASRRQDSWTYQERGADGGWDLDSLESEDDFPFLLKANDPDYHMVWKEDNDLPADYRLWSVFPHMHYAGKSIRISLDHNDGSETCLASIEPWDFAWQLTYIYDKPYEELPTFYAPDGDHPGDTVVVDCHYDNTMENDRLADGYRDNGYTEPFDILIGENALDDMCVMHYGLLIPWEQRNDQ